MHRPPMKWLALALGLVLSLAQAATIPQQEDQQDNGDATLAAVSDRELEYMADYLTNLLREDPWARNDHPLLYIEAAPAPPAPFQDGVNPSEDADDQQQQQQDGGEVRKRSRYYRRYPWKRVSRTRSNYYDSDMFACNPSRHDVLQLLVGLHRAREGDLGRTINFCNRKRPASAVFTNIRFIGKRK